VADTQWSLVAFTVLAQAAVGMTLVVATIAALGVTIGRSFRRALIANTALMGAALLFSFLHLGNVTRAVYAVSHWRSSWLSREVVLAAIFFALLVVTAVIDARDGAPERPFDALLALTVLVGVALVTVMARVYMVPTVPPWRGPATPVAFAVTTVLLGASAMLVVSGPGSAPDLEAAGARCLASWLVGAIAAALLLKLGAAALLAPRLAGDPVAFPPDPVGGAWRVVVWAAVALGVAALARWVVAWRRGRPTRGLALFALVAFVVAEVVERALFYAAYFRLGV